MSPKADLSTERRLQIFQAALRCFSRHGYYQTTMDDIVVESGLSKGTLYWYFDSKKALFLDLFQWIVSQIGNEWGDAVAGEGYSAEDKIRASLALFRHQLKEMADFFGVMMEAWAQTRHDQEVEALTREFYRPFLDLMGSIIEEGIASGAFAPVDAEAMALVIMTMFDGITLAAGMDLVTFEWERVIDAAETMVLRGLGLSEEDGGRFAVDR